MLYGAGTRWRRVDRSTTQYIIATPVAKAQKRCAVSLLCCNRLAHWQQPHVVSASAASFWCNVLRNQRLPMRAWRNPSSESTETVARAPATEATANSKPSLCRRIWAHEAVTIGHKRPHLQRTSPVQLRKPNVGRRNLRKGAFALGVAEHAGGRTL